MLHVTSRAAVRAAAAAKHTLDERPPYEATVNSPPCRPTASALTFVVQVLMGIGNETQELVYISSGEGVSDASGEREHWRMTLRNRLALALETLQARVQGTPPLALALGQLLPRVQCTPQLALALGQLQARVKYTPPQARFGSLLARMQ